MEKNDGKERRRVRKIGKRSRVHPIYGVDLRRSCVDSTRTNRSRFSLVGEFGLRLFLSAIGKWCVHFAMRMTPVKGGEGKGLFLDSRVKKPGGRSRAKRGKARTFGLLIMTAAAQRALLHCEKATKNF